MAPISDEDWPLSTDYDGHVMCQACDEIGILLRAPECWDFTIAKLTVLVNEHRKTCRKRSDA